MTDIVVIGRGPAGISAAIYALRAGRKVTVIAHDDGALARADRINNYYGFPLPITGKELVSRGIEQAKSLGAEFIASEVTSIKYDGDFIVSTSSDEISAKSVVIATGAPRKKPDIKGIDDFVGAGVSYCAICDAFFFRGANVAVLGGGEYALNELNELLPLVNKATVLTNGEPSNATFPAEVEIIDKKIASLSGNGVLEKVLFEDGTHLDISGLFIALGIAGGNDLAKKLGIITDNNGIVVSENMETNVPGVFAVGDCTKGLRQVSKAVADGAIAGVKSAEYVKRLQAMPETKL